MERKKKRRWEIVPVCIYFKYHTHIFMLSCARELHLGSESQPSAYRNVLFFTRFSSPIFSSERLSHECCFFISLILHFFNYSRRRMVVLLLEVQAIYNSYKLRDTGVYDNSNSDQPHFHNGF